jgi:uncharacterized sulfatase
MRTDREARTIMRRWNRQAYRWAAPLAEPLGSLEQQVLSDMYDAEVAYQDSYLGPLFDILTRRRNRENTLTVIVADHGDGLGEHSYFGHAFVAYQELVHVPLLLHWPGRLPAGKRFSQPVSTRRVYHTVVDAAGPVTQVTAALTPAEIHSLALPEVLNGRNPEPKVAFTEVYPPLNFVKAIHQRQPELLERFGCLSVRRALVKENYKLIQVDNRPSALYDIVADPLESKNLLEHEPAEAAALSHQLDLVTALVHSQQDGLAAGAPLDADGDEQLARRLRGLGYIE